MARLHRLFLALVVVLPACEVVGLGDDEDGSRYRLTATARSATTLELQWDAMDSASGGYTVDYFTGFTTCDFPPEHLDVQRGTSTSITLSNLTPATQYQIHVHALPGYEDGTNLILVSTLPAGASTQTVAAADYTICD